MKKSTLVLSVLAANLIHLVVPAAAQSAKPISICLKAYSQAESAKRAAECPALSESLNRASGNAGFDTRCVTGPEVFNKFGCGVYDAAIVGEMTAESKSVSICIKAYSNAETKKAVGQCEGVKPSFESIGSDFFCYSGKDSFFTYGCGAYDAVLRGRIN